MQNIVLVNFEMLNPKKYMAIRSKELILSFIGCGCYEPDMYQSFCIRSCPSYKTHL